MTKQDKQFILGLLKNHREYLEEMKDRWENDSREGWEAVREGVLKRCDGGLEEIKILESEFNFVFKHTKFEDEE